MTKYFFGYYLYHGKVNAICWPVIDGIIVGAFLQPVQQHEITEPEWKNKTISELVFNYPYVVPAVPSITPG